MLQWLEPIKEQDDSERVVTANDPASCLDEIDDATDPAILMDICPSQPSVSSAGSPSVLDKMRKQADHSEK